MIVGVGIDLVEISRFDRILASRNRRVIDRLFTPGEQAYCDAKGSPAPHYAARFAAKEAFFKALGTGVRGGLTWQDAEVVSDRFGRPALRLSGEGGRLCRSRGVDRIHLSLSHERTTAAATVILEMTGETA